MKRLPALTVVLLVCAGIVIAGGKATDRAAVTPFHEPSIVLEHAAPIPARPSTAFGMSPSTGSYTTLEGFYDYQSNGGVNQYIRVDSALGKIHVIYMMAEDSLSPATSRRTAYALSTDDGATWNNFANVRVPTSVSGFPGLALLGGTVAPGSPLITNHNNLGGTGNATSVFVGDETGSFTVLPPIPVVGPPEPIWPFMAAGPNGEIIVHSSVNTTNPGRWNYITRTTDYGTSWDPWVLEPTTEAQGGRNPIQANGAGRVGTVLRGDTVMFLESTNNGATWLTPVEIYPPLRYTGQETLGVWVGVDLTYDGNQPIVALNTSRTTDGASFFFAGSRIEVWTPTGGLRTAVPWDASVYPSTMVTQTNHLALGYPAIAMSGTSLVIAFQAFLDDDATIDTLAGGRLFGEIFIVQSTDGGSTWSLPINVTNTPQLDERYPSISKWNPAGYAYITWQEDTRAGSHAFQDNSPVSRSRQVFYKANLNALFPANDITAQAVAFPIPGNALKEGTAFHPRAVFRNIGLQGQSAVPVRFEILNAAQTVLYANTQTIPALAATATVEVTFDTVGGSLLAYGRYTTRAIALNPGDVAPANDTVMSTMHVIPVVVVTGTYTEDFEDLASEAGGYGWYAALVAGEGEPDWVRGTPAKPQITGPHGGTKAYVTKVFGDYSENQESILGTPVLNLSSFAGSALLEFYQNFNFEPLWDGGWLQYSTDGGATWLTHDHLLGTGPTFNTLLSTGWYNSAVDSQVVPGAPDPPMWGFSTSQYAGHVNRWIRTTTLLPVGGAPDVRLRWYFSADGSVSLEGWAIDDVTISDSVSLSAPGEDGGLPKAFALEQNYPNPFNPSTTVGFALPVASRVTVEVFNVLGQRVTTLADGAMDAGYRSVKWNGTGAAGQQIGSGVYLIRFKAAGVDGRSFVDVRKALLMK